MARKTKKFAKKNPLKAAATKASGRKGATAKGGKTLRNKTAKASNFTGDIDMKHPLFKAGVKHERSRLRAKAKKTTPSNNTEASA